MWKVSPSNKLQGESRPSKLPMKAFNIFFINVVPAGLFHVWNCLDSFLAHKFLLVP